MTGELIRRTLNFGRLVSKRMKKEEQIYTPSVNYKCRHDPSFRLLCEKNEKNREKNVFV